MPESSFGKIQMPLFVCLLSCCIWAGYPFEGMKPAWSDAREAVVASQGWPAFRGPQGNGIAVPPGGECGLPVQWSETENIVWKTELPLRGWSTPVILKGRIWLTTATEEGHEFYVLCVEEESGKIRLTKRLFHTDTPEPLGNLVNSYASPSAVVEAGRVYVHFGSYGTACLDTAPPSTRCSGSGRTCPAATTGGRVRPRCFLRIS